MGEIEHENLVEQLSSIVRQAMPDDAVRFGALKSGKRLEMTIVRVVMTAVPKSAMVNLKPVLDRLAGSTAKVQSIDVYGVPPYIAIHGHWGGRVFELQFKIGKRTSEPTG